MGARLLSFQLARARVANARADSQRALLLPNPTLDLSANTLPVGETNPAGVGFAETCPTSPWDSRCSSSWASANRVSKRPLRPRARRRRLEAQQLRLKVLELEDVIGDVAAAQVRTDALEGLADDAGKLASLQRARARRATPRSSTRIGRASKREHPTALGEARAQRPGQLRLCARWSPFPARRSRRPKTPPGGSTATWSRPPSSPGAAPRPSRPRRHHRVRARGRAPGPKNGWIPDPTLRVGYVRDQFVVSGNQQNSLFVGVSLPLPIFDHHQDDADAAAAAALAAERARDSSCPPRTRSSGSSPRARGR